MDIKITDRAEEKLSKLESKSFRITFDNDCGWISMAYDLVPGEPMDDDVVAQVGDRTFFVQNDITKDVDFFEIDFHNGWFRKVFVVYPNGESY